MGEGGRYTGEGGGVGICAWESIINSYINSVYLFLSNNEKMESSKKTEEKKTEKREERAHFSLNTQIKNWGEGNGKFPLKLFWKAVKY